MFIAYAVLGVILATVLAYSARAKLVKEEWITKGIARLGFPLNWFPFLAACESAGAVGLVVGLWYPSLGIVAAVGLVLFFIGAVSAHLRARDFKGAPAALMLLAASTVALILAILSD